MKTRSMLPILAVVGALAVVSPELTVVDQAIALDGAGPGYGNKDTATRNKRSGGMSGSMGQLHALGKLLGIIGSERGNGSLSFGSSKRNSKNFGH